MQVSPTYEQAVAAAAAAAAAEVAKTPTYIPPVPVDQFQTFVPFPFATETQPEPLEGRVSPSSSDLLLEPETDQTFFPFPIATETQPESLEGRSGVSQSSSALPLDDKMVQSLKEFLFTPITDRDKRRVGKSQEKHSKKPPLYRPYSRKENVGNAKVKTKSEICDELEKCKQENEKLRKELKVVREEMRIMQCDTSLLKFQQKMDREYFLTAMNHYQKKS